MTDTIYSCRDLFQAIEDNDKEMINRLLPYFKGPNTFSFLRFFSSQPETDNKTFDPNELHPENGNTPLIQAIIGLKGSIVATLLSSNEIDRNKKNSNGETPLIVLAKIFPNNQEEQEEIDFISKLLLGEMYRINLNEKDESNVTALYHATLLNKTSLCELLLRNKADVNQKMKQGQTVVHTACATENNVLATLFFKYGAKDIADDFGTTPSSMTQSLSIKHLCQGMKTSHSHPFEINFLTDQHISLLGNARIGMCMCPGRNKKDHRRDLNMDLNIVVNVNTHIVISLIQNSELELMKIPTLIKEIESRGMQAIQYPIPDKWLPESTDDFLVVVQELVQSIQQGKTIVIHCNGGKGRTGLVVGAALVQLGATQSDATDIMRSVRPGMFVNPAQRIFLKTITQRLLDQQLHMYKNSKT